jgi:hypothetical protein
MASKKLSDLTAADTPLAGDELLEIEQDGNSRKVSIEGGKITRSDAEQQWTKPQRSSVTSLSVSSNEIDWTLASSNDFSVTLDANATLNLPSDIASYVGQKGRILIIQDGTGSRTFAVDSGFSVLGTDTLPDVLSTAGSKSYLAYDVISSSEIAITLSGIGG